MNGTRTGSIIQVATAIVVAMSVGGLVAAAQTADSKSAPGLVGDALVDIGGRRLHLSCGGSGSPTVILEAGLGDPLTTWKAVQPAVAETTRVCSYDRAGLGTSDRDPRTAFRTSRAVVDDLSKLLRAAGVSGPYVLVGHSLGGAHIRLYATRFPRDVVGMVLVDASHEDQYARVEATGFSPPTPAPSDNSERMDMVASLDEVGQEKWRGDIPLVVLSHGRPIAEGLPNITAEQIARVEVVWADLQRDLASRSSLGRLLVAERSGHYVHVEEPSLVIGAIREVVAAVRRK
jgi:pimeloyl-ACP methyl ester carboxylesterase